MGVVMGANLIHSLWHNRITIASRSKISIK
jgi:hypothetical protein